MTLSDQVRQHVETHYVAPARRRGESTIRVRAGDVHRDLRWTNRVPSVCSALASQKFQKAIGVQLLTKAAPPSGSGTRAVFTYKLAPPPATEEQPVRLEDLYGIAKDVFRELGGGENFIRRERENFDFRYDANVLEGARKRR